MFARLPPLNAIRVFESAARLGSFKAAAVELNVTATAVSHQIRGLEDRLGVSLFQRSARSVSLTLQGQRLAAAAQRSLAGLSLALEDIGAARSTLTISTTAGFAAMWLVPRLAGFREANPGIDVRIQAGEQIDDLQRNPSIDLAIRYGLREQADERLLVQESFGAYAGRGSVNRRAGAAALRKARLIETRWQNEALPAIGWQQWLERYAPRGPKPMIQTFDQEHHAVQAAMAGQGVVLASDVLVRSAEENGWLTALQPERRLPGFVYYWASAPGREDVFKTSAFLGWLRAELDGD